MLDEVKPLVWREFEVPLTTTLKGLHDTIQAVMPWQGYHLYEFRIGENRYGVPDPEWADGQPIRSAKSTRLAAPIGRGVTTFAYLLIWAGVVQNTMHSRHEVRREVRLCRRVGTRIKRGR